MFFVLSKILDFLLQPISWIFIAILYYAFARSVKHKKYSILFITTTLLLLSNGKITSYFYSLWEVPNQPIPKKAYKYGVVLTGGIIQNDGMIKPEIHVGQEADRLIQAAQLYKMGVIKHIVISGGNVSIKGQLLNDYTQESQKSAKLLQIIGIPDSSIIIEVSSRNTHENALFTKKLLDSLGNKEPFLLITSAYHMKRSSACFSKLNMSHECFSAVKKGKDASPGILSDFVPDEHYFYLNAQLIHEIVGFYIYKIMGYC